MKDRILPLEAEKIAAENKIQESLEAGKLISYDEYEDVLDDESRHRIEKRLREKGIFVVEIPGDGYAAK